MEVCPRVDEVGRETSPHADLRSGRIHGSGRPAGAMAEDGTTGAQGVGITAAHPRPRQPTGLPALDAILRGGFPIGALSQVRLVLQAGLPIRSHIDYDGLTCLGDTSDLRDKELASDATAD